MLILTVNSGSTSVKLAAFDVERGGEALRLRASHSESLKQQAPREILGKFLSSLQGEHVDAVGHRVVHGGTTFTEPTLIDAHAADAIDELSALAPLHNPAAVRWIEASRHYFDAKTQHVAVFDTSFFADMPRVATAYAVPQHLGEKIGVRRYGFHGLAHGAMRRRWSELHPALADNGRLISLQLGGGCSMAAIAGGRAMDISMGFSPLEGLMMATRSGDIDAAVIPYLEQKLSCSSADVIELLNTKAGLAGVSGGSSSITELLADPGTESQFAVALYCYRARKYLGAFLAVLGGCDGIVFGGGVGEHVPEVRRRILEGMEWAGIFLDAQRNDDANGVEAALHASNSIVSIHAIPVDEQTEIARGVLKAWSPRSDT